LLGDDAAATYGDPERPHRILPRGVRAWGIARKNHPDHKEKAHMRSIKLTAAIAAAATFLALAAAGASALPHLHRGRLGSGKCHISLFAEPHMITSGESVGIFGQLLCLGRPTEGQPVTVYEHTAGSPGITIAGTPTTGEGGFYSLPLSDVTNDGSFYASALTVHSATKVVRVEPVVTLKGPPEPDTLFTGHPSRVTFEGTVNPADEGALLVLQREAATADEEWHPIELSRVGPGGVYSITHTFIAPGDANIRVLVPRHGRFSVRGVSNTLSYVISQRENPNLTINTTDYQTPDGSPVTLSGTLAAGQGKTVTLQERTRGNEFATLTTGTTGSGGTYQFSVTPPQNIAYRVIGAGVQSAVLFQGVKFILTPNPPPTTVEAGQPMTLTGTVTPAIAGKTVYLERENKVGGGYHVVDVGSVLSNGTYSITDYLFGVGDAVLRVKVPGNPEYLQISSAPFTVDVTAAPAGSLKPSAQPKVPNEGTV
jgi:hypothetical protein